MNRTNKIKSYRDIKRSVISVIGIILLVVEFCQAKVVSRIDTPAVIALAFGEEFGPEVFLEKTSNSFRFQAFGCVLGFD